MATDRDLRLDFFRGLGLLFIFLDHIPENIISYFTLGNVAFCDAAELFVFISGFTAALVFGRVMEQQGIAFAGVQILKRCWTLYVAHVFLFVIFIAQVSYTAARFDNPMFLDEMKVADFLQEPHIAVMKAVMLQFQPEFMDILPLYIVLLLGLAVALPILRAWPTLIVGLSIALYIAAAFFHFNLRTYPNGVWYFNPFAWQILFVLGAASALRHMEGAPRLLSPRLIWLSAGFLAAMFVVRSAMTLVSLFGDLPPAFVEAVWTIADKTNLGPLRLLNFLALAHVTVTLVRRDHPMFNSLVTEPVILCGQHSLNIFCLGIFLSVLGHFVLSEFDSTLLTQFLVSGGGVLVMFGSAYFLAWSKQRRRPVTARGAVASRPVQTVVQGGE
ncbi:MAG TPA: OpgC domain-containing protein [Alphaproteobacteria bacterium]